MKCLFQIKATSMPEAMRQKHIISQLIKIMGHLNKDSWEAWRDLFEKAYGFPHFKRPRAKSAEKFYTGIKALWTSFTLFEFLSVVS